MTPGAARIRTSYALAQRAALLAALWWALTDGRTDAWLVGAPAIAAAALASLVLHGAAPWRLRPLALLRTLGWFLGRSVLAGTDVALRALRPRADIAPGFVVLRTRLAEPAERVLLANALSLLPGTLSVELRGERLELHVLDRAAPVERDMRRLEERIAALTGAVLEAHGRVKT
jgi:multicomponent Na+:H+ antiporter subunit E